tara:strand:- start:1532 stop:1741 length:210 start_codon:yes stop_codon:yes gene_type:complete
MKFECKECKKTKDIYKVSLSAIDGELVCKDAKCCDEYMEQVMTEEYQGLTTNIQRNEGTDGIFKSGLSN